MTEQESALRSAQAWLDRWAAHVGRCEGADKCTCGLTAVRHETAIAVQKIDFPQEEATHEN